MRLLVRTWNLFHGRTVPESGRSELEAMVRLIADGDPDVVCLQEVPVAALDLLAGWSGKETLGAVTMPALGGRLGRRATELDPRRLRSALTGQANAVLLASQLTALGSETLALNPRAFRRREGARLGLPLATRLAWLRDRRVGQVLRVGQGDETAVVVNLHLTASADSRPAEAELLRAATFAEGYALPDEPIVIAGDLNLTPASSWYLRELESWGFSPAGAGLDHVLARGLTIVRGAAPWPNERRRLDDRLLSDHAPVEAEMMTG
jgi:endonuclease/exonuclease/phosphatase family metal-dependent hydrolase